MMKGGSGCKTEDGAVNAEPYLLLTKKIYLNMSVQKKTPKKHLYMMRLEFHYSNANNFSADRGQKVTRPAVLISLGNSLKKTEPQQALCHGLH